MKKLISLLLALTMVFSLAICASAAATPANFDKVYTVNGGEAPAETFTYEFTIVEGKNGDGEDVTDDMPELDAVTTSFGALTATTTNEIEVSIDIDEFPDVGRYVYSMKEVDNNTAGVTYDPDTVYLVVTITRSGDSLATDEKSYVAHVHYSTAKDNNDKVGQIENIYDAGSLKITKEITGNMADMNKKFQFTVTLTPTEGDSFRDNQNTTTSDVEPEKAANGVWTYTFTLGDGENIVIDNIPTGTKYTVSEEEENYDKTVDEALENGTITSEQVQVDYVNDLTEGVDTGISLDSMPFVLILAVCAGAAVLFVIKRRSVEF